MENDAALDDLTRRYERTLLEMDASRIEAGGPPDHWNRLVDRLQAIQLELRSSREGRDRIEAFLEHENATIREWSASFALAWAVEAARACLQSLTAEPGIIGLEAQVTLREFDAGRLDTTWDPRNS